jgi:TRAP-type C4-dicarboxylate transport system substrate-binding protein
MLFQKKKTIGIVLTLLLSLVFVLSACGSGSSGSSSGGTSTPAGNTPAATDDTVYELSGAFIPQAGTSTVDSYEYIKEYLFEKSDGRIVLNIFPGGQLGGSDTENAESCAQNIFQMTTAPTHTIAQYSGFKEYSATTIPFLFTKPEQLNTFVDSDMMEAVNATFTEQTGLRIVGGFCDGFMGVSTVKTPFKSPADLKGLKIRTQDAENYINSFKEMGISAIPMSAGEIFTSLQQGTIDGISGIAMMIVNEHYYEILKYYADVNAFANYHMLLINDEWYQSLPDDLKVVFDDAMVELTRYMRDTVTGGIEDTYGILADNGMTVTRLTDAERQVWKDASINTYNDMKAQVGNEIVTQIEELLK